MGASVAARKPGADPEGEDVGSDYSDAPPRSLRRHCIGNNQRTDAFHPYSYMSTSRLLFRLFGSSQHTDSGQDAEPYLDK